jgi:hypothetical protein
MKESPSAAEGRVRPAEGRELKYPPSQSSVKDFPLSTGLTSDEARRRIEKFGPNAVPDTALHPLRRALIKFWAPVPWILEAPFQHHSGNSCSNGR